MFFFSPSSTIGDPVKMAEALSSAAGRNVTVENEIYCNDVDRSPRPTQWESRAKTPTSAR